MALLLDEGVLCSRAELLLGPHRLAVACEVTIEWLQGTGEPTWYGHFTLLGPDHVLPLPGAYQLQIAGDELQILLRRPTRGDEGMKFPFWGVGRSPRLSVRPSAGISAENR